MPLVDALRLDRTFSADIDPTPAPAAQTVLFTRARALKPNDRLLLELAFKNNLSVRQIGRIFQRPAGTISRKVNRLCARLRDPLVAALLDPACPLSDPYRQIAIEYFAQGRQIGELARARTM